MLRSGLDLWVLWSSWRFPMLGSVGSVEFLEVFNA